MNERSAYVRKIYNSKNRPKINWDRLKPVDIVDVVLDKKATRDEVADLAARVMRDHIKGRYNWVWKAEQVALDIAKAH